jgi:hypothetical protein
MKNKFSLFNKVKIFLFVFFVSTAVNAQLKVGNNPTTISSSAVLDVESTNKGFLPPRVALIGSTDGITIPLPSEGLIVYNTGREINGPCLAINLGSPSSPKWSALQVFNDNSGSTQGKLVYTGTPDPQKTIKVGSAEFRIFSTPDGHNVEMRLNNMPSVNTSYVSQRINWYPGRIEESESNNSYTTSNYSSWQAINTFGRSNSNIAYTIHVFSPADRYFYKITALVKATEYVCLVVEAF